MNVNQTLARTKVSVLTSQMHLHVAVWATSLDYTVKPVICKTTSTALTIKLSSYHI